MRNILPLLLGAAVLTSGAAQAESLSPDAKLAKLLDGRVAGAPVDCISIGRSNQSSQVIPGQAIVYKNGSTLYVNRPRSGAEALNDRDVLISRTTTTRLCSTDTLVQHDRYSHMMTGVIFLGEFVPYKRVETSAR